MGEVKKISIFDPARGAYCEVDVETAKKFIESAKEAEKQLKKLEEDKWK